MLDLSINSKLYELWEVDAEHPPEKPHALVLYDYWLDKRGQRGFPSWRDIDLLDIWEITPYLIVKDVIGNGEDFRNRFWGTQITHRVGFDASGKTHCEVYEKRQQTPPMRAYSTVFQSGTPHILHRSCSYIAGREFVTFFGLLLPLGSTEDTVEQILMVVDFE
ncbi:MAG: PAS domain-containing protein [Rhodospirillales bacterium]|nr:PAS domain-containing protein [Rhodospirillales bacterium]MBO6786998.1 PAS domain-containing protein [Rhodospirillales bacterium]